MRVAVFSVKSYYKIFLAAANALFGHELVFFAPSDVGNVTPQTHRLIDAQAIERMKPGAMLISAGRGALIDTQAVIHGLKSGKIDALGLDVYEEEADLFFEELSDRVIQDDVLTRLLTFPNVLITGHQGFFTQEALKRIAETTLANLSDFERGRPLVNEVKADRIVP